MTATVASPDPIDTVTLVAYLPNPLAQPSQAVAAPTQVQPGGDNAAGTGRRDTGGAQSFEMSRASGLEYSVELPGDDVQPGTLRYHIAVRGPDGYTTFPSELDAFPTDWTFYGKPWETRIVPPAAPIPLFDAGDWTTSTADHRDVRYDVVPSERPGMTALEVMANGLAEGEHDVSFRYFLKDKVNGRQSDLEAATEIVLYGRSATARPCTVQLALVTADGIAYGAIATVQPQYGAYSVPVSALHQVRAPNIPHGYPVFIHFWSSVGKSIPLDLTRVESVLVSIGPGIPPSEYDQSHGLQIERIWLD